MTIGNTYDASHELATEAAKPGAMLVEEGLAKAAEGLDAAIREGTLEVDERPEGWAVFVAPVQRNTRYLVNPTERRIHSIVDPNSPTGKRQMSTDNDVWLEFRDGICIFDTRTVDGEKRLAWAQSHPEVCRNIDDPMTAAWVQMKEAQTPTSRKDNSLPTGLDVDALLRGDARAQRSGNATADRARRAADAARAGQA